MDIDGYHLVLPVKVGPSSYGGGWAAGSIIAHWFHLKKGNPGVCMHEDYDTEIHGAIVCGQADEELRNRAKARGFKVIEYRLILDIPLHELIT